jgi:hypothetical protein
MILQSHWVMVVMDQFTRRIVGFAVHAGPIDGPSVCRLFNSILGGSTGPRYLSSDNDPLFKFHRWKANLRILDVAEIKTVSYVPLSHPFVERLIGTVRREFLDHVPFWGARDLERKLHSFKEYYNQDRVHRGLDGAIPDARLPGGNRNVARLDDYGYPAAVAYINCRSQLKLVIRTQQDRQDLLGHRSSRITTHYSGAELRSLIDASNSICGENSRKSPALFFLKRKSVNEKFVTA